MSGSWRTPSVASSWWAADRQLRETFARSGAPPRVRRAAPTGQAEGGLSRSSGSRPSRGGRLGTPSARALLEVLERVRWNRTEAARVLKVSYKTLLSKLAECGIPPARSKGNA